MAAAKSPSGLDSAGKALWRSVAASYELRPDELATLEQAAFTADMIARLSKAWSDLGCPMTTKGSMGQEVIHPLVGELRAQRSQLGRLMAGLKLPDDAAAASDASSSARAAAAARWKTGA